MKDNNKVNQFHERALRIVYQDFKSSFFSVLFVKDNSFTLHQRNLYFSEMEIFKVNMSICPEIMNEIKS